MAAGQLDEYFDMLERERRRAWRKYDMLVMTGLEFNRVEVRGAVSPFVVRSEPDKELAGRLGATLELRDTGIWYWGVGTFLFPSSKSDIVIPAGFESKWFTLATGGR